MLVHASEFAGVLGFAIIRVWTSDISGLDEVVLGIRERPIRYLLMVGGDLER